MNVKLLCTIGAPTVNGHIYDPEMWKAAIEHFMKKTDRPVTLEYTRLAIEQNDDFNICGNVVSCDGNEFKIQLNDTEAGQRAQKIINRGILPIGFGSLNPDNHVVDYSLTSFVLATTEDADEYAHLNEIGYPAYYDYYQAKRDHS